MNKNKNISLPGLFLTVIVLVLSVSPWPLRAYDRQELVDSAAIIVRVSNAADFLKAIERSSVGQLWNSKEMRPFLNNQSLAETLKETFSQILYSEKPNNKEISHLSWESTMLLKDELVVGLSPPNQEGKTDFFLVAALDKPDYLKSRAIDERIAELDENKSAPHKQEFQGVDLFRVNWKSESNITVSQWEAFYEGTVVSGTNREWVERCIVQLKKELPAVPTAPPTFHVRVTDRFVNAILESQKKSINEEHETEETIEKAPVSPEPSLSVILNALGLAHLKHISLDLFLKPKAMEFQVTIKTKGAWEKGIWTLFTRERVPLNHRLAYVPDDVYSYQVMQMDFNALWEELPEILKSINPQYVQYLQGFKGMFAGMYKIDLSRDVFGNLGTLITTFSRMEDMKKQELFAWQLRNPDAMEKLLAKLYGEGTPLAAQLQDHLEIHQLHGHKLYSFITSSIEPGDKQLQQPGQEKKHGKESTYTGVSVVGGALVFGSDILVRSLIQAASNHKRTSTNTLYQLPGYTTLMRKVPDDAVGYSIIDASQLVQSLLGLAKNAMMLRVPDMEKEQDKDKIQSSPLTEFFNKLQFERLPPADFIKSFFDRGIGYTRFEGNDLVTRVVFQYRERK